jgi:hypothetical protein
MGGFYYRQTLGGGRRAPQHHALPAPRPAPGPDYATQEPIQEIESGEVSRLVDHPGLITGAVRVSSHFLISECPSA